MDNERFFEEMQAADILQPIMPLIRDYTLLLGDDGKIRSRLRTRIIDSDWIHIKHCPHRQCWKWMRICWERYQLLAEGCMGCWKICMKLDTLDQAMAVHRLQQRMDLPSKTGIEKRFYAGRKFSAFWYGPILEGLGGARKLYKRVKRLVHKEIDPRIRVILKRGCTELELALGPSDQWERTKPEKAKYLEMMIDATFENPPITLPTPEIERTHIYARWGRHWEIVRKKLLHYGESIHNPKDFPIPYSDWEGGTFNGALNEEKTDCNSAGSETGVVFEETREGNETARGLTPQAEGGNGRGKESKLTIL
jgi:hypothetical protein